MKKLKEKIKIIAIVGQTGSGKTVLSIEIAKKIGGEIINADSRAIYRGCDIATAKPTKLEQEGVPHHLFDIAKPDEVYTVSRYKEVTDKTIADINTRKKIPIMIGGTGLYFDAVLKGFEFPPEGDLKIREKLEKLTNDELLEELDKLDIDALNTIDRQNRRRIVRALEVCLSTGKQFSKLKIQKNNKYDVLWLGIKWDPEDLKNRLLLRADKMIEAGVLEETKSLIKSYPQAFVKNLPAMTSIGYPIWKKYLDGDISLEEAKNIFTAGDWHLARRQATWWRKNSDIHWFESENALQESAILIKNFFK